MPCAGTLPFARIPPAVAGVASVFLQGELPMRKLLLTLALVAIATPALATRHIPIVAPYRAGQAQGSVIAVRGHAQIRPDVTNQGTDINLVDDSGRVVFVGFVSRLNEYAFPHMDGLNGKTVVMYGVIELYRGVPATQLLYRDQLRAS